MADNNRPYNLVGKNFTPPDIRAKVTGRATYSEDYRADGMAYIKMLLSPMPHALVTNIDASAPALSSTESVVSARRG